MGKRWWYEREKERRGEDLGMRGDDDDGRPGTAAREREKRKREKEKKMDGWMDGVIWTNLTSCSMSSYLLFIYMCTERGHDDILTHMWAEI